MNARPLLSEQPVAAESLSMCNLIATYESHMKAAGLSGRTIGSRVQLLERVNRDLPYGLAESTTEELADFLARDGWSRQTRAAYYGHIRAFFVYHCDPRRPVGLDWDPSAGLTRPRVPKGVPRPITDEELALALTHAREPWRRCITIAAYAGLRAFEIQCLRRQDITEQAITVRDGKGGRARVIPKTHELVWAMVRDLPPGPIVAPPRGARPQSYQYLSNSVNREIRRVGADFTLHRCRHWFATMMLRAGYDLRTVQGLLGHSSPATTAVYTQVTDEQRRNAVAALPAVIPTPR